MFTVGECVYVHCTWVMTRTHHVASLRERQSSVLLRRGCIWNWAKFASPLAQGAFACHQTHRDCDSEGGKQKKKWISSLLEGSWWVRLIGVKLDLRICLFTSIVSRLCSHRGKLNMLYSRPVRKRAPERKRCHVFSELSCFLVHFHRTIACPRVHCWLRSMRRRRNEKMQAAILMKHFVSQQ